MLLVVEFSSDNEYPKTGLSRPNGGDVAQYLNELRMLFHFQAL
jgi:hypothetical protein